jgi:hypothetical protein
MTADEIKEKAPMSAAFAAEYREVFGEDVKLRIVREGEINRGQDNNIYAPCIHGAGGVPLSELYRK